MRLQRTYIAIAIALALTAGFSFAHTAPLARENPAVETRMAECIEALAASMNDRDLEFDYGVVEYRYDAKRDLCLYRGNRVGALPEGRRFEKFIVDAFTGTVLARYAELDGKPVTGNSSTFAAEVDTLFGTP